MSSRGLMMIVTLAALLPAIAWAVNHTHPTPNDSHDGELINMQDRIGDVPITRVDGQLQIVIDGQPYSAEQFIEVIEAQQQRRDAGGPLFKLFNITTLPGIIWVGVGLLGQLMFTGRMLVQWIVSEKHRRSVVPPVFWYMSLVGASMLLAYFIWRKDIVGVLGQGIGWVVYLRNVALIQRHAAGGAPLADEPITTA